MIWIPPGANNEGNPTIKMLSAVLRAAGLKFGVSAH